MFHMLHISYDIPISLRVKILLFSQQKRQLMLQSNKKMHVSGMKEHLFKTVKILCPLTTTLSYDNSN